MPKLSPDDIIGITPVKTINPADIVGSVAPPVDPSAEAPGTLEALARGGEQGLTFGFGDELNGGLTALNAYMENEKNAKGESSKLADLYKKYRDLSRQQFEAADKAHPIASTIGNIAGAAAPILFTGGTGALAEGANLGTRIAEGAKAGLGYGGIYGLGSSNADLTQGDVSGAAKDVGKGAFMGGLTGGALPIAGAALKGGAQIAADLAGNTQLGQDVAKGFEMGTQGKSVLGPDAVKREMQAHIESTRKLFDSILDGKKTWGELKGQALQNAADSGAEVNLDALKQVYDGLKSKNENYFKDDRENAIGLLHQILYGEDEPLQLTETLTKGPGDTDVKALKVKGTNQPAADVAGALEAGEVPADAVPMTGEASAQQGTKMGMPVDATTQKTTYQLPLDMKDSVNPEEANDILKQIGNISEFNKGGPADNPVIGGMRQLYNKFKNDLNKVADVSSQNEQLTALSDVSKILDANPEMYYSLPDEDRRQMQAGMLKAVGSLSEAATPEAKVALDNLKKIADKYDPKWSSGVLQPALDQAQNYNFVNRLGGSSTLTTSLLMKALGGVKNAAIGGANLAGRAAAPIAEASAKVPEVAEKLSGLSGTRPAPDEKATHMLVGRDPEQLKAASMQLRSSGDPDAARVAGIIDQASSRDLTGRNALMFALEQNPKYRDILKRLH